MSPSFLILPHSKWKGEYHYCHIPGCVLVISFHFYLFYLVVHLDRFLFLFVARHHINALCVSFLCFVFPFVCFAVFQHGVASCSVYNTGCFCASASFSGSHTLADEGKGYSDRLVVYMEGRDTEVFAFPTYEFRGVCV